MEFLRPGTATPPYIQYPRFLLALPLGGTAKLVYCLLLDRARLSQANGWTDEENRVYAVYPISALASDLGLGQTAVKCALRELETQGLICRHHTNLGRASHILVCLPPPETRPGPRRKSGPSPGGNPAPSQNQGKRIKGTSLDGRDYTAEEGGYL